jgi:hypothetical protein
LTIVASSLKVSAVGARAAFHPKPPRGGFFLIQTGTHLHCMAIEVIDGNHWYN